MSLSAPFIRRPVATTLITFWVFAAGLVAYPLLPVGALPAGTPDEAGACLGIPALTALHAVLTGGGVEGRSVLVAGGAGAVGHYAVQFARQLGAAQVITTVSSDEKAAIARTAGADLAIDYRRENVAERVREATAGQGVQRVIEVDIAANRLLDLDVIASGGDCVVYGSGQGEFTLPFFPLIVKNLTLRFFIVYNLADADRARAEAVLADFLRRGVLQHCIAQRLPLAQCVQAHELVESGRAIGNVVVELP